MIKLPTEIMCELAERVRKIRKQKGFSRQKLSELSGISYSSIRRFETSGRISFEALVQIALPLNRLEDFDKLFEIDNYPKSISDLFKDEK
jgi:transcriptional regulator with XRE-family HTH domain